jgi:hypothetical protein
MDVCQWVKTALQTVGPVAPRAQRGRHHQRRECRPLRGMLLYVDGSTHTWIPGSAPAQFDLVAVIDDATSACDYAQLVEQESTATVLTALRAEQQRQQQPKADRSLVTNSGQLHVLLTRAVACGAHH